MKATSCRICRESASLFFHDGRSFFKCSSCAFIFSEEWAGNDLAASHYKAQWTEKKAGFWKSQVDTLLSFARRYLEPRRILDFGSGRGEILEELKSRGYDAFGVDPLINGFLKSHSFESPFDLVLGVEVIEHLPNLWEELGELEKVIAPQGIMIFSTLLTNPFIEREDAAYHFKNWWYKDDPTHVNFFNNTSLLKLAEIGNYAIDIYGDNIFAMGHDQSGEGGSSGDGE